jgi:imidazolonepropionase-like amidohydrolase
LEEIFCALTYRNAIAFRLENKIGTIAAGKQANVLILNENPLKTIAAYNQIETVIIRGKAVKRSELSAVNY